jgi:predicted transglutaminase-like cysteine proteinase
MNYRNRKLLDSVRGFPCQHCLKTCESVCAAHSNQQRDGKGMGIKAHDYRIAALCQDCHREIDSGNKLEKIERVKMWEEAHRKTIGLLFQSGKIGIVVIAMFLAGCAEKNYNVVEINTYVNETRQYEFVKRASYMFIKHGEKGNCSDFAATKQKILGEGKLQTCTVIYKGEPTAHAFLNINGIILDNRTNAIKPINQIGCITEPKNARLF